MVSCGSAATRTAPRGLPTGARPDPLKKGTAGRCRVEPGRQRQLNVPGQANQAAAGGPHVIAGQHVDKPVDGLHDASALRVRGSAAKIDRGPVEPAGADRWQRQEQWQVSMAASRGLGRKTRYHLTAQCDFPANCSCSSPISPPTPKRSTQRQTTDVFGNPALIRAAAIAAGRPSGPASWLPPENMPKAVEPP